MKKTMNINTYPLFRLFSSTVVKEWAQQGASPLARELFLESNVCKRTVIKKRSTIRDFYDAIFELLSERDAQREYIFKSVIVSQLWSGEHTKNSLLIPEFRVGECRADMVVFNGTSTAYEIKTERDNLNRLENQLREYGKVFDKIILVTTPRIYCAVKECLPLHVGVKIFDEETQTLVDRKRPKSNKSSTFPLEIFNCLRKDEYSEILLKKLGVSLNEVAPVFHRKIARELFLSLPPEEAHREMVRVVKRRKNNKKLSMFLESMPRGLFARLLSLPLSFREITSLSQAMTQNAQKFI